MNRDGNAYTFIYATAMVIVVAAILSFAALSLKPLQTKNVEIAKKSDILKSVNILSSADDADKQYEKYVTNTYVLNFEGQKIDGDAFSVNMKKELAKEVSARNLPIYECKLDNGELKYIIPMRGKGLWGPIWGYVALNEDKKTIFGASFDHQAETPGLGAEISQDFFTKQFAGKEILKNGTVTFEVVKGKAAPGNKYAVDGVSGGTITSKGLENMMLENLGAYERFLKN